MTAIKDNQGNTILEIDERLFPLMFEVDTVSGVRKFTIRFSYVWDDEKKKKDHTKIRGAVMN